MSFLDKRRASVSTTRTASVPQATTNIFVRNPNLFIAVVAISVTLAVGGSVLAGLMIVESKELHRQLSAESVSVVVANRNLVIGETLDKAMLTTANVPQTFVSSGALKDISQAIGRQLTVAAGKNTQITTQMLSGEGNVSSLANAVSDKMVATSVAVSAETGLAGLLLPQDRIDLLVHGEVIAKNVRVLALDGSLSGNEGSYTTVTLELTTDIACVLQSAQDSGGHIRLVVHSASDKESGE